MIRTRSGPDISPRSKTSLPTMTAAITSGNRFAKAIAVSTWWRHGSQGIADGFDERPGFARVDFGGDHLWAADAERIQPRHLLELGQILVDLPRVDGNIGAERVLIPSERGVRDAVKLPA